MCNYLRNLFFCEFQSDTAATAAMEVCSAVSGETLAVLDPDEFEGKSAKYVKQCLSAKIGITRFRQKLLADGFEVFALASVKVQLVILDFWPPDEEQDEQLISASSENDAVALEELLQQPRTPNVTDDTGKTALHHAAAYGHATPLQLLLEAQTNMLQTQLAMDGRLWTALEGHLDTVRLLVDGPTRFRR